MSRWYVVEDNRVVYSCSGIARQKAMNFLLDYTRNGRLILAETEAEAIAEFTGQHIAGEDVHEGEEDEK